MKIMNGLDLNGQRITNQADPTSAQDSATKNYVDNIAKGLEWHQHVRVATSTNTTLSAPGATIDGVTMANGDRVLLMGQTTGSQNGLWVFNGSASALTRPTDYAAAQAFTKGSVTVLVTEGTLADKAYTLSTDGTVTVDTTSTSWVAIGGGNSYTAGNGLQLAGSTFSVLAADGSISVSGSGVTVGNVPVSKGGTGGTDAATARAGIGAVGKYSATISPTAATPLTVNHNLNTRDVQVKVYDAASGTANEVMLDVAITDANNITVTSATALSNYRVVVVG